MAPSAAIKWAVSSVSLGKHATHTLEHKISALAKNDFQGIEVVFNDLVEHAQQHQHSTIASASLIRSFAEAHNITILSLNAFKNFEGSTTSSLDDRLSEAQKWADIAVALGTRTIQVPSIFLLSSTNDNNIIVSELRTLADVAAGRGLDIAYEAVAFAAHNPLWQDSLRITKEVNRKNFRICLDSYHIHARLWGDACTASGRIPDGDSAVSRSMTEFLDTCPKDLVSYMQLSDASRWDPPLSLGDAAFDDLEVRDPRLLWSRVARPFPLEEPGYFPVIDIAKTWLVDYEWGGWVSLEGFLTETAIEEHGPEEMARRANESRSRLLRELEI
ncbi:xylose isomerase-like protein [Polyplosphaeria fusca]|uniref:Xylose isomerase-like protein n=1 Tax=Polyplosphaeria fusca TaxID=682080 RepID=A0A9P4UYF5_9PLEO|nr:xylose isomerase-like protein [Polyplosphaeria fusca]